MIPHLTDNAARHDFRIQWGLRVHPSLKAVDHLIDTITTSYYPDQ
jgi:hypothetical protein